MNTGASPPTDQTKIFFPKILVNFGKGFLTCLGISGNRYRSWQIKKLQSKVLNVKIAGVDLAWQSQKNASGICIGQIFKDVVLVTEVYTSICYRWKRETFNLHEILSTLMRATVPVPAIIFEAGWSFLPDFVYFSPICVVFSNPSFFSLPILTDVFQTDNEI